MEDPRPQNFDPLLNNSVSNSFASNEEKKLVRTHSLAYPEIDAPFDHKHQYNKQISLKDSTKENYSLGIVRPDDILNSIPKPPVPVESDVPFIPLTQAVPIKVAKDIKGVKILPPKDEIGPVFTPPAYDKKTKKFYHPFFHREEGVFYGMRTCSK